MMKRLIALLLSFILILALTACGQSKPTPPQTAPPQDTAPNEATTPVEESVWAALPDEEGFENTLREILSDMSNTDIVIEDYKSEEGHISCTYLNGTVYFMGRVIDGKVTTSYAYTSLETFNQYKDSAGQSFLGLVIAPLALYNADCTDGKSLFAFVDSVASSREDENDPKGKLEQDGIEYTFSTQYMLSCQARYVEDMSIYDEDDLLTPSDSTLPEPGSSEGQNDPPADTREKHTLSGSFTMSDYDRPCFVLTEPYTFVDDVDGTSVTIERVYFYPDSWVQNAYEGFNILALGTGSASNYTVTGHLNNYRGGGDFYWEDVSITPNDYTSEGETKICPVCGGGLNWQGGAWICDSCAAAY